jgi:hypothetical protein
MNALVLKKYIWEKQFMICTIMFGERKYYRNLDTREWNIKYFLCFRVLDGVYLEHCKSSSK